MASTLISSNAREGLGIVWIREHIKRGSDVPRTGYDEHGGAIGIWRSKVRLGSEEADCRS